MNCSPDKRKQRQTGFDLAVFVLLFALASTDTGRTESQSLPASSKELLETYCLDCHSDVDPEGDMNLDVSNINWNDGAQVDFWEKVYDALHEGEMPPSDKPQPSAQERDEAAHWLHRELQTHSKLGGTTLRRLNREEYENTIRNLFGLEDFQVPSSFPADDSKDGFDNVGAGLVLSPPLLAEYLKIATLIADEILPPQTGPVAVESRIYNIGAAGLTTAKGSGAELASDRYRLSSSRNMASSAGWPARFEVPESGVYRLSIDVRTFQTDRMFYEHREQPFQLGVYARPNAEQVYDFFDNLRELARFEVDPSAETARTIVCDVELYQGDVFGLRWIDGPAYSDPPVREYSTNFLADRLIKDRRYYAAMLEFKGGPRGATQTEIYEGTLAVMQRDDLDLTSPELDTLPTRWGGGLSDAPHNWIKAFVLEEMHRHGPALDVLDARIEGPLRLIDDENTLARKARTKAFLGKHLEGISDEEYIGQLLQNFLTRAFRRPANASEVSEYTRIVLDQIEKQPNARIEDGLHLAVRRALVSPSFLYRSLKPGKLDDYDLASRLSYFLTSAPPDAALRETAQSGTLARADVLRAETERLIGNNRVTNFVSNFTGQWLGTRTLKSIMPDPRLVPFFDSDRRALIRETELFFAEILQQNLSLDTFIDPDFSYRNVNLNKIYGGNLKGGSMQRITFAKGGRYGGILGMGSTMMATANGVDTQPILRGVWLLENVFGSPTPEPPGNVPAIAPDTTGTTDMRSQLNAHRADPSCARCHNRIDPIGMVMENFDPVGRWRDHYPIYSQPKNPEEPLKEEFYKNIGKGTRVGPEVDAVGVLEDGTRLDDVTDLKKYLVENIDQFSSCLTQKLLTYATGRSLNFADQQEVEKIVAHNSNEGNGFRNLIHAIVQSDSFQTK